MSYLVATFENYHNGERSLICKASGDKMIVFAIDPGNTESAYCVMNDQFKLMEFAKLPNDEVMSCMKRWQNKEIQDRPGIIVIERVASYGMAVGREVFETCEWIGRYTQAALENAPVEYIYRKDEKVYLCGDMRAKDSNIRQALIDRFAKFDYKNGRGTKNKPDYFYGVSKDVWAAIAIAVTYYDMQLNKMLRENKHEEN